MPDQKDPVVIRLSHLSERCAENTEGVARLSVAIQGVQNSQATMLERVEAAQSRTKSLEDEFVVVRQDFQKDVVQIHKDLVELRSQMKFVLAFCGVQITILTGIFLKLLLG